MVTIRIYWNATKFTTYEHIWVDNYQVRDGCLDICTSSTHELLIPLTTINRVEFIKEDS